MISFTDTVYVDSHRPDIPWYIGTIKEVKHVSRMGNGRC